MVIEYGFSDKLGAIKWGSDDDQTTVMDGLQPRKYSDRTAEVIDDEVLKLVETAHAEAGDGTVTVTASAKEYVPVRGAVLKFYDAALFTFEKTN